MVASELLLVSGAEKNGFDVSLQSTAARNLHAGNAVEIISNRGLAPTHAAALSAVKSASPLTAIKTGQQYAAEHSLAKLVESHTMI